VAPQAKKDSKYNSDEIRDRYREREEVANNKAGEDPTAKATSN